MNTQSHFELIKVALVSVLFIASCGSNSTGTMNNDNNGGGDDNPTPSEPTFSNVQVILNNNCAGSGCHVGERTNGVRLDGYNNVMESVGNAYNENIVQPNDAAGSPIVDKIEPNPEFGSRMPENMTPLSSNQISLIRDWIDNGAMDN